VGRKLIELGSFIHATKVWGALAAHVHPDQALVEEAEEEDRSWDQYPPVSSVCFGLSQIAIQIQFRGEDPKKTRTNNFIFQCPVEQAGLKYIVELHIYIMIIMCNYIICIDYLL